MRGSSARNLLLRCIEEASARVHVERVRKRGDHLSSMEICHHGTPRLLERLSSALASHLPDRDISSLPRRPFQQINKRTGHRLRQQMVDEVSGKVVDKDEKGRGYELSKGATWRSTRMS
jgi:hypothetical protein